MIDVSDRMIGIGSKQNIKIPINSLDINDRNFTWALDENFSFELAFSLKLQSLATDRHILLFTDCEDSLLLELLVDRLEPELGAT